MDIAIVFQPAHMPHWETLLLRIVLKSYTARRTMSVSRIQSHLFWFYIKYFNNSNNNDNSNEKLKVIPKITD